MKSLLILSATLFLFFSSCSTKHKQPTDNKLAVGVFSGNGASLTCVIETLEALKIDTGITAKEVSSTEIQEGILDKLDVLIFPGGSGSKELNNLGQSGVDKVYKFIKQDGKGLVGICAGAYLLSTTPGYPSLELSSAKNIDRPHYDRGRALVEFRLNDEGNKIFPELKNNSLFLQYYDGPILAPLDSLNKKYNEIGTYISDIHPHEGYPLGITPGKSFLLNEQIGKGQLFIVDGHPEATPGMRWMIPRMARWVSKSELISYDKKWVRPELNDSEIMYTAELIKFEKAQYWTLFGNDVELKLKAMDDLYRIRSRPAVRWNIGLLRDNSPKVRKKAAKLLMETEYSYALPDLLVAQKLETDIEVKKQMDETIRFLKVR